MDTKMNSNTGNIAVKIYKLPVDMDSDLVTANIQVQILTLSVANITESPPPPHFNL